MLEEEKVIDFMKNHKELIVPSCKESDDLLEYVVSPAKEDPNFEIDNKSNDI